MLFFLAFPLAAQVTTYFAASGDRLGQWERIAVSACNGGAASTIQTAAALQAEAARSGFTLATNAEMLRLAEAAEKTSWQRRVLIGVEIAGWVATALAASDLIVIREKWKAAFPLVSGGLRFATTAVPARRVTITPRPTLVQIGPGECAEHDVWAARK